MVKTKNPSYTKKLLKSLRFKELNMVEVAGIEPAVETEMRYFRIIHNILYFQYIQN